VIAFVFPGQGAQAQGVGLAWRNHPAYEIVEEASEATGVDVARLLERASAEELQETVSSQLAQLVSGLVITEALEDVGVDPVIVAGHSLGEYTALAAAGMLSVAEVSYLVSQRAAAMRKASELNPGTMVALLGIDWERAQTAASVATRVWVANDNAPDQVVVAGDASQLPEVIEEAKRLGAKRALPLKVSGAFHTPFMAPAREPLEEALGRVSFGHPSAQVFANVDARPHSEPSEWPDLLVRQLTSPVRWRQIFSGILEAEPYLVVELGGTGVLTSMGKRMASGTKTGLVHVATPSDLDALLEKIAGIERERDNPPYHSEPLYVTERIVVSPANGVFRKVAALEQASAGNGPEAVVAPGDVIGYVGVAEVFSAFEGRFVQYLALDGERVKRGQPLAFLRAFTESPSPSQGSKGAAGHAPEPEGSP
jgi:[acyl-carrier-protein] S-malonyltransferase